MDPETGFMQPIASYFGQKRVLEKVAGMEVHWPGSKNEPPPDIPFCGFSGDAEACSVKGEALSRALTRASLT